MSLSKLILGTVQLGLPYGINNQAGQPSAEQAVKLLYDAYAHGIRLLDTAQAYGNAPHLIGQYHAQFPNQPFDIITKFKSSDLLMAPAQLIDQVLRTLHVSKLQTLLFHGFADYSATPVETLSYLQALRQKSLIDQLGVSVYSNEEALAAIATGLFDVVQLPFNLLDNWSQRHMVLKQAAQKGVQIHTRSVFLQGLFFISPDSLPLKLRPLANALTQLRRLADTHRLSLEHIALRYALQQPFIAGVLVGVDSTEQLAQNVAVAKHPLPDEVIEYVDQITVDDPHLLSPLNWT